MLTKWDVLLKDRRQSLGRSSNLSRNPGEVRICGHTENMRIGARGQVTIPKSIREQFGLGPETEVEFSMVGGSIVLKKASSKLNLAKWKGCCNDTFAKLGYSSVDEFIADVRGRWPRLRKPTGQIG
jgi:AbrB family looped-hinge helix DNA binding protein